MTPKELRTICEDLNPGGQTRLAKLLPVNPRTIRRWLAGETTPHEVMVKRIRQIAEREKV